MIAAIRTLFGATPAMPSVELVDGLTAFKAIDTTTALRQNDIVQLRPGYEPGVGLSPFVVECQIGCQVFARQHDIAGSIRLDFPRDECHYIGHLGWTLDGRPNG